MCADMSERGDPVQTQGRLKQSGIMKDTTNFLLAGVGGQGTILASDVLVHVGLKAGYQTKQAEVHGMSQRGGSVTSYVRWGRVVYSPLVGAGEVDILLAFEKAEALRNLRQLRPGGLVLINLEAIEPITVTSSGQAYPTDEHLFNTVEKVTQDVNCVAGAGIAEGLGNARVANVVLLGALSWLMEKNALSEKVLSQDVWLCVIAERVPEKYLELNHQAFQAGRDAVSRDGRIHLA
jgi:indolepyruvate ferredoxin oxidoreductase beta subunit